MFNLNQNEHQPKPETKPNPSQNSFLSDYHSFCSTFSSPNPTDFFQTETTYYKNICSHLVKTIGWKNMQLIFNLHAVENAFKYGNYPEIFLLEPEVFETEHKSSITFSWKKYDLQAKLDASKCSVSDPNCEPTRLSSERNSQDEDSNLDFVNVDDALQNNLHNALKNHYEPKNGLEIDMNDNDTTFFIPEEDMGDYTGASSPTKNYSEASNELSLGCSAGTLGRKHLAQKYVSSPLIHVEEDVSSEKRRILTSSPKKNPVRPKRKATQRLQPVFSSKISKISNLSRTDLVKIEHLHSENDLNLKLATRMDIQRKNFENLEVLYPENYHNFALRDYFYMTDQDLWLRS